MWPRQIPSTVSETSQVYHASVTDASVTTQVFQASVTTQIPQASVTTQVPKQA